MITFGCFSTFKWMLINVAVTPWWLPQSLKLLFFFRFLLLFVAFLPPCGNAEQSVCDPDVANRNGPILVPSIDAQCLKERLPRSRCFTDIWLYILLYYYIWIHQVEGKKLHESRWFRCFSHDPLHFHTHGCTIKVLMDSTWIKSSQRELPHPHSACARALKMKDCSNQLRFHRQFLLSFVWHTGELKT